MRVKCVVEEVRHQRTGTALNLEPVAREKNEAWVDCPVGMLQLWGLKAEVAKQFQPGQTVWVEISQEQPNGQN